jgi:putative hydrolase of the HAD superfamily
VAAITAVTFDLWQTLILDNRELGLQRAQVRLDGAKDLLGAQGLEFEADHIREAYRGCYRACREVRNTNKDVSFRTQVEIFIDLIEDGLVKRLPEPTIAEIERIYAESFFDFPPRFHDATRDTLHSIHAMGFRIGLISNTGMTPGYTFREFLRRHDLLEYFDVLTFSDEVLLAKPSDEIFLMTMNSLGSEPHGTIHVGDHVSNDVVGANRVGMKSIWIRGFYEPDDPDDPYSQADAAVDDLSGVSGAVQLLATG